MKKLILIILPLFILACENKQEVELDLPVHDPKPVVECYLQPGKKYEVFVMESISYFEEPEMALTDDAKIRIYYLQDTIELAYDKFGTYKSDEKVPFDYENTFYLEVEMADGRMATASTKIERPVEIDTVKFSWDNRDRAAALVFWDDPAGENQYRIKGTNHDDEHFDRHFEDKIYNGSDRPFFSTFKFKDGDTLTVSFVSVSAEYFLFLRTNYQAHESQFNPLIEPVQVYSNIDGGYGIFTGVDVTAKGFRVRR